MKVLIIGATGLLAKPVIKELDASGYQLRLFSRNIDPEIFGNKFETVRGDVFNQDDLEKAINGCDAIHISLSTVNEAQAVKGIVEIALREKVKLLSYISGCTVSEENRWFPMIDNKFRAEKSIIESGIPYLIFRPTWFFETLDLMIRDGKAMIPGNQQHPCHWVAAGDFGMMVANAYRNPEVKNNVFFVLGPQKFLMKDLLEQYCKISHPEIGKVSVIPIWVLKIIATFTGNKELKNAASLFAYFEKVSESGNPDLTNLLLGRAETTFEIWADKV